MRDVQTPNVREEDEGQEASIGWYAHNNIEFVIPFTFSILAESGIQELNSQKMKTEST